MNPIYVFLAIGFEDVEAIGVIDVCRRADLKVITVSITGNLNVTSSHGISITTDMLFEDGDFSDAAMLFLPGGLPGATNLDAHEGLRKVILSHHAQGKPLAAICAAPMVYGNLSILEGINATCYPGFDKYLKGANYTAALVEHDGQFFTGKGPAATLALGYAIVEHLVSKETAEGLKQGMMYYDL